MFASGSELVPCSFPHIQSPTLNLSPSDDEEWVALQEQLAEEEQEKEELEKRKRELGEKIDKLSDEITKVKRRNAELQAKVRRNCIKNAINIHN